MKKIILFLASFTLMLSCFQPKASAASYDKATTNQTVKVYESAGISYRVRFKLPKGKAVKVLAAESEGYDQYELSNAEKFGFYFINYKGKTGWVSQGSLKFKNPYNWVPGIKLEAIKYADYYADGEPYRFVKNGTSYTEGYYRVMVKIDGKWYHIGSVNCKTGWAHG